MTEASTRRFILEAYSRGANAARQVAARLGGDASMYEVSMLRRAARPLLPHPSATRARERRAGLVHFAHAAQRSQP